MAPTGTQHKDSSYKEGTRQNHTTMCCVYCVKTLKCVCMHVYFSATFFFHRYMKLGWCIKLCKRVDGAL